MRDIVITVKVYKFSELNVDAQNMARATYLESFCNDDYEFYSDGSLI